MTYGDKVSFTAAYPLVNIIIHSGAKNKKHHYVENQCFFIMVHTFDNEVVLV